MIDFVSVVSGREKYILAELEKWLACSYSIGAGDVLKRIVELDAEWYDKTHRPEPLVEEQKGEEDESSE